jgi:CP family cyanate transporter-like MFS transporter
MNSKLQRGLAWLSLIVVAALLRPAIADLGPLIPAIQKDLALSVGLISFIGALPTIGFGLGSLFIPSLARRFGVQPLLLASVLLMTAAILLRPQSNALGFVITTAVIGITIAAGNTLLPVVVRQNFSNQIGLATGIYTTVMASMAGIAAWSAVPLAGENMDWKFSLSAPAVIGVIAAVLLATHKFKNRDGVQELHIKKLISNRFAWDVTLFLGMQSTMFYATLTWVPTTLQSIGFTPAEAGNWLSYLTTIGIPLGLFLPMFLRLFRSYAVAAITASVVVVVGTLGFALFPGELLWLWLGLMGIGGGLAFPLSLAIVTHRAATGDVTTSLSAMSQGFGYLIAAVGTYAIGVAAEFFDSWTTPLWILGGIAILQLVFAGRAGSESKIH